MTYSHYSALEEFINLYQCCPQCQQNLELLVCGARSLNTPKKVIYITNRYYLDKHSSNSSICYFKYSENTDNNITINILENIIQSVNVSQCFLRKECPKKCFFYESLSVNLNKSLSDLSNLLLIEQINLHDKFTVRKAFLGSETNCFINDTFYNINFDSAWWFLPADKLQSKIENLILLS